MEDEVQYSPKRRSRLGRVLVALIVALADLQGISRRQSLMGAPNDLTGGVIICGCPSGNEPHGHVFYFTD